MDRINLGINWLKICQNPCDVGLHGQYVYVQQDVGVIIVKLSDYPTDGGVMSKKVADVMQQIANQI